MADEAAPTSTVPATTSTVPSSSTTPATSAAAAPIITAAVPTTAPASAPAVAPTVGATEGGSGRTPAGPPVDEAQQAQEASADEGAPAVAPPPTEPAPAAPPAEPAPTTTAPPSVGMPAIVGLSEEAAYQAVIGAQSSVQPQGYSAYSVQRSCNGNTDPANFGRVYSQTPPAGSPLTFRAPATASIYQSCTRVPEVVGLSHSAASTAIYGAALQVVVSGRVACEEGVAGSVVTNQDPAPGTILPNAAIVNLVETAVNCP